MRLERDATIAGTGLLDLPPEIWSKIVKLAVECRYPINVLPKLRPSFANGKLHDKRIKRYEPAVAAVCRKIREECLPHYYKTNIFVFFDGNGRNSLAYRAIQDWLIAIRPQNVEALTMFFYIQPAWMSPSDPPRKVIDLWYCQVRLRGISDEEYEVLNIAFKGRRFEVPRLCISRLAMGRH